MFSDLLHFAAAYEGAGADRDELAQVSCFTTNFLESNASRYPR